jgi:hypothetical protein
MVFGRPMRVVRDPAQTGAVTLWIGLQYPRPAGFEKLHLQTVRGPRGRTKIVLTGSDMRGTIYAVYEFSQRFLGVDPLYWWTDNKPARRTHIEVPDSLNETAGPTIRYRGWFVNDEDLLTGWTPGVREGTGISLKTWDRVFEAILRLKGNMVVPGTWIFPYEPQIQAAADRGLVITQHHVNVLGLDTYKWPNNKPYSFTSDPQLLEEAWRTALLEYPKNAEVIDSVGYRGQNDYPFWLVDKNAPSTDAGRAEVIRAAIDKEIEIAKQTRPAPMIVMNAWREAAQFIREGFLHVPEGVTTVWPDNGHGLIEDGGRIGPGQGIYYHTAMFDYLSNHYSEMIPLGRIQRELGRAVRAGATSFLLVNTSNIRPVAMTTRAVMELAWNPRPWLDASADPSTTYLRKWSAEEFGEPAADALTRYYQAYFAAPGRYGAREDAVMADNFYQTGVRDLLLEVMQGGSDIPRHLRYVFHTGNLQSVATAIAQACREAEPRWAHVNQLAAAVKSQVRKDRLDFFQANVLTQAAMQTHANRMLLSVAEAVLSTSASDRLQKMRTAIAEAHAAESALEAADYGKWRGYYTNGDWLLDFPRTIALANAYVDRLQGRQVPEDAVIRAQDGGFAYHMITAYQGTEEVRFSSETP